MVPWKVLVVDDEEGIHGITRMIFRGYEFEQRPIELISAMSGAQARDLLIQHPDIALALLDVVMETDNEGLQLVEHIRNELNNHDLRIILRTGHPGYAPEAQVIVNYDINDYLSKAELSASRLLTSVVVGLRSYRDIKTARIQPISDNDSLYSDHQITAEQLYQQMTPILKQSQRLQQFELNPVAQDITLNLHAQHQRLQNSIGLLHTTELPFQPTQIDPVTLLNNTLQIFLPQSRRDGWLLDYRLDSALPAQWRTDANRLKQLLISAVELVILSADGHDLKLTLQPAQQAGHLLLSIKQNSGLPIFTATHWSHLLQQHIRRLSDQLQGQLLERDESGAVHCILPF
ncbi:response regulator [Neptunomonas antarctica]|uniref:Response regulator receiver domain-containing protein n=1 Tax=Neptunomonas antarctica TaxID=619304 RepID=A0A1N7LI77_9GAMM|nr:response regulator [Neptunomonas antarctica]SIS73503.1 Response regulator receiver domain-containing protein [Neptunomonas antarctica]